MLPHQIPPSSASSDGLSCAKFSYTLPSICSEKLHPDTGRQTATKRFGTRKLAAITGPDFAAASMMAGIFLQHLLPFDIACEQAPYILLVSNLHVLNVCMPLQPLHSMALLIMKEKILLRF